MLGFNQLFHGIYFDVAIALLSKTVIFEFYVVKCCQHILSFSQNLLKDVEEKIVGHPDIWCVRELRMVTLKFSPYRKQIHWCLAEQTDKNEILQKGLGVFSVVKERVEKSLSISMISLPVCLHWSHDMWYILAATLNHIDLMKFTKNCHI